MKKVFLFLTFITLFFIGTQVTFAQCQCTPCVQSAPCACNPSPYQTCCYSCCEAWLNCQCIENYLCQLGLSECKKCDARNMVERFKCETNCLRCKGYKCESKCDCRKYRKELCNLDYEIKKLLCGCQKDKYKCIRNEIKDQVRCCHRCLIWPISFGGCCKCSCNCCCN